MTLGRCPLSIFCSRGTPPRANPESITIQILVTDAREEADRPSADRRQGGWRYSLRTPLNYEVLYGKASIMKCVTAFCTARVTERQHADSGDGRRVDARQEADRPSADRRQVLLLLQLYCSQA